MYKELIISTIIIFLIFGLNYITQKNTQDTIQIVTKNLEVLRQDTIKEEPNKEIVRNQANIVYEQWEDLDDRMAYYIEHDELEKVKTALTEIRSSIETDEYAKAIESIDKCTYILEHIHEKEMFTLDNIF